MTSRLVLVVSLLGTLTGCGDDSSSSPRGFPSSSSLSSDIDVDSTNSPRINSRWSPIGPTNANVFTIARSPQDSNVILAGTFFGGLYRTEDRGINWTHVTSPFSTSTVFSVAFAPNNPSTIYVGTFGTGVFKSVDDGRTWTDQNDGLTNLSVSALAIDPFDSKVILVATDSGVFRSINGGATWSLSNGGFEFSARSLAFDPNEASVVYLGTLRGGSYRSSDSGLTWQLIDQTLGQTDVTSLDFDNNGDTLYASTGNGVFRLDPGSSVWEDITHDLPSTPVNQVAEHPRDGRLFAATEAGVFTLDAAGSTQTWRRWTGLPVRLLLFDPVDALIYVAIIAGQLLATTDDGATFFRVDQGIQNLFAGSLAATTTNGVSLIYAGSNLGVHLTSEFFASGGTLPWVPDNGFDQNVFGLATHPTEPNVLFAGTERAGVWKSTDWGVTWEQTSDGIVPTQIFDISQSPVGNNTLYAGTNAGLYVSRDDGLTWTIATNFAISTQILSVVTDPVFPGVAYFATPNGSVFETIDDGRSFQSISVGLPAEAILHLAVAPFGNLYAVTASGDLYVSSNGGAEWFSTASEINQRIISVATDPVIPWKAYVGTSGGGVYRTTSNAITWEPVNNGLTIPFVFSLAVDHSNGDVIYAGTVDMVFKSIDGGETWFESGIGLPSGFVHEIEIDRSDSATIYVSVADAGIYKTTDGGQVWTESVSGGPFIDSVPIALSKATPGKVFAGSFVEGMFASVDGGQTYQPSSKGMTLLVRGIAISAHNPNVLFAGSLGGGIFRSTDGGKAWSNQGLGDRNIFHVVADPLNADTVYAATSRGVVRSTDGGETWVELGQKAAFVFSLVVDPADRNVIYTGSIAGRVFRSMDGGVTWDRTGEGLPLTNILALDIDPNGTVYAAAERQGIYKSIDDGQSWQATNTTLIGSLQVVSLTVDPLTRNVYAAANDAGLYVTTDGGATWGPINNGFQGEAAAKVVVDPFDGTLYAAALNNAGHFAGVSRSIDGGNTWTTSSAGLTAESVLWIVADPRARGVLYAATNAGVFKSIDGAATWQAANVGLEGVNVATVLVDPSDGAIYAGTAGDGVYKSTDSAGTWIRTDMGTGGLKVLSLGRGAVGGTIFAGTLGNGLFRTTDGGNTWSGGVTSEFVASVITHMAINPQDADVLYVAASGLGVFKTTDGGVTWSQVGEEIPNPFILAIAVDPVEPDTVYVGTTGDGVYVTENGGTTWAPLNDGLFNTNVTSLLIDPLDHRIVYVGTEGGGVFRSDRTPPPTKRTFHMGFTSIPPANTSDAWIDVYTALRDHADLVVHNFQEGVPWVEALQSSDYRDYSQNLQAQWELLRSADQAVIPDHDVYLMINPIETSYQRKAPYWGESTGMPLPPPWDALPFNHPDVKQAFVNYLVAAIEFFNPTYLAISVEANILLAKRPLQWQAFKELNEHVYTTIKTRYPNLKVFSTIHYEHMLGLHTESAELAQQLGDIYPTVLESEVRALMQHSDLLAISTYPYMVFGNPLIIGGKTVVTPDYYNRIYAIADDLNLPIAIDQTGYISQDLFFEPFNITIRGSEELQANFLSFLLQEAQAHEFAFISNFVAQDYGFNHGTDPTTLTWAFAGLLNLDGTPKPALAGWDVSLQLPLDQAPNPDEIQFAGSVQATTVGADRVDFVLENGFIARVELLDSDIVRVRVNAAGEYTGWLSGAISPSGLIRPGSSIFDTVDATYLKTDRMTVIVHKAPFRVTLLRPDGSLITADQEDGIGWNPQTGLLYNRKFALEDEAYFGLGLRGGPLNRRGDAFFMRNTDNFGYGEFTGPLYSSTPFYYGARDSQFYGLFLDSPAEPFFDMDTDGDGRVTLGTFQPELDYYIFLGPEPADVARQYAKLTGFMPLPPMWALGFHQSRFGYRSWDEILNLARTFRDLQIPAGAFYLDLDYMNDLDLFSWDPVDFPDPVSNNQILEDMGFKRISIVDPSIQLDDPLYDFFDQSDFFLQDAAGNPVVGSIFQPFGEVSWFDFSNPAAAQWYIDNLKTFMQTGVTGIWNDINEPANNFMPQAIYDFVGQKRNDREGRNLYALTEVALTQQAMLELRPNERPFILSRSGYPGSQRYNANWSGDSLSTFDSLRVSIQLSQHMALSGMILFGHDIGGFLGTPSAELFTRWLQFASFNPFMRNHAVNTSASSEPWVYGEPYTSIVRDAINQRYRLMPYLYSLVERASRTAEPVLAPVFFHFKDDPQTFAMDTEFMLGEFMLVAPVFVEGAITRTLYLPAGADWYDLNTGVLYAGGQQITVDAPLERIPTFIRAGAIIPGGPLKQYVDEPVPPRVNVDIYPGADDRFTLYEDDGNSFNFRSGQYLRTVITASQSTDGRVVAIEPAEGEWIPPRRPWWLYFHGVTTSPAQVSLNNMSLPRAATETELDGLSEGWFYRASDQLLIVRLNGSALPSSVRVQQSPAT